MFTEGTQKQIAYANDVLDKEINEADKVIGIIAGEIDTEPLKCSNKITPGEMVGCRIVNRWKGIRKYLPDDFEDRLIKRAEEIIEEYKEKCTAMTARRYLNLRVGYGTVTDDTLPLVQVLEKRLQPHGDFQEEYKKAKAKSPKKSFLEMLRTEK